MPYVEFLYLQTLIFKIVFLIFKYNRKIHSVKVKIQKFICLKIFIINKDFNIFLETAKDVLSNNYKGKDIMKF